MKTSPAQRSLKAMRDAGYIAEVVERRVPFNFITIDYLGCIDILAIHPDHGIIGVQTTTDSNTSSHIKKCVAEPRLRTWLQSGGKFIMHTWGKHGDRGKRKVWRCRTYRAFVAGGDMVVFEKGEST